MKSNNNRFFISHYIYIYICISKNNLPTPKWNLIFFFSVSFLNIFMCRSSLFSFYKKFVTLISFIQQHKFNAPFSGWWRWETLRLLLCNPSTKWSTWNDTKNFQLLFFCYFVQCCHTRKRHSTLKTCSKYIREWIMIE